MADNIDVKDGNLASKTMRTTDNAGVHTPHHIVESSALPNGAATESSLAQAVTALTNLLTELQLKADLTDNQPVLTKGDATDYSPYYNGPTSTAKRTAGIDPEGQVNIRGPIHTDESSVRINFANSAPSVTIGAVTVSGTTVTGSGFLDLKIDKGDYFKIQADTETSLRQIESIDSDTQITLASAYTGAGSGTGERWIVQTVTGSGATISVASGQCTIAAGTTANAITEIKRLIDFSPVNGQIGVSISQRIANQDIYIGFRDPSSTIKYFTWFRLTGTTNTVVNVESGYNPTTAPSASETASVTSITLPNGITTASIISFRVETSFDRVRFYAQLAADTSGAQETLLAEIKRVAPHPNDPLEMVVRVVNGATPPASNTNIVVDYAYIKNFNKLQVEQSGNNEGFVALAAPGQTYSGSAGALNADAVILDCSQISELFIQASGTFSLTCQGQWANDPTFTGAVAGSINPIGASVAAFTTGITAVGMYRTVRLGRYFRLRNSAYTSGTINITAFCTQSATGPQPLLSTSALQVGTWTVQPGNTANTTAWLVNNIPNAAQGASTTHHLIAAGTTNATSVKASAGNINQIILTNTSAAIKYFKLYNKASAPTVGTDTPILTIGVQPNQTIQIPCGPHGLRCSTGIAYATTTGVTVADTGAVTANDLAIHINYT